MDATEAVTNAYQVQCVTQRHDVNLPWLIEHATRRVYILTTNADYSYTFLREAMHAALEHNRANPAFRIVVLTMNPESEVTNGRAEQLGIDLRKFRDELRTSLESMAEAFKDEKKVDILTYRTLPTQIAYIVDDVVVTSIVSLGIQSRDGLNFVIQDQPTLTAYFTSHFGALRAISTPVKM